MCASVEAFIVPGCIALALRGLWPNPPTASGSSSGDQATAAAGSGGSAGAGGQLNGEGEFSPLLLTVDGGSSSSAAPDGAAVAGGGGFNSGWRQQGAGCSGWLRSVGGGGGWSRAGAVADVSVSVLAIVVGGLLVVNGIVQPLLGVGG
jgi:hypothetical protein